jgi:hypothetical protein
MVNWNRCLVLLIAILLSQTVLLAQGCSDAGFCTIESFKPSVADTVGTWNHQVKMGAFYGSADNRISVHGAYVEYNRRWNAKWGSDVKLTSLAQRGNQLSVIGLSDVYVNANYKAGERFRLTLGLKVPLTDGNREQNERALPMDYQASLGTLDLLVGFGYSIKKLQVVMALQQPLTQNGNQFLASSYASQSVFRSFQSTREYKRSGDVLLRLSYPVSIHSRLKITPSLLPIYHLQNDTFMNESNREQEIEGSQGLTLNGNFYVDYTLSRKHSVQLNAGMPFLVRAARPDGLTRGFIANLEYKIRF